MNDTATIPASADLLGITAEIVAAHVGHNPISAADVPGLIASVFGSLSTLGSPAAPEVAAQVPAVNPKKSVFPDYLISLESGKRMKMLKRYLMTNYNMTPQDYRTKWNLPADYPMVAPNYAAQRRDLAVKIGLGKPGRRGARKADQKVAAKPAAKPRAAKPKATAPKAAKPAAKAKAAPAPKAPAEAGATGK